MGNILVFEVGAAAPVLVRTEDAELEHVLHREGLPTDPFQTGAVGSVLIELYLMPSFQRQAIYLNTPAGEWLLLFKNFDRFASMTNVMKRLVDLPQALAFAEGEFLFTEDKK